MVTWTRLWDWNGEACNVFKRAYNKPTDPPYYPNVMVYLQIPEGFRQGIMKDFISHTTHRYIYAHWWTWINTMSTLPYKVVEWSISRYSGPGGYEIEGAAQFRFYFENPAEGYTCDTKPDKGDWSADFGEGVSVSVHRDSWFQVKIEIDTETRTYNYIEFNGVKYFQGKSLAPWGYLPCGWEAQFIHKIEMYSNQWNLIGLFDDWVLDGGSP